MNPVLYEGLLSTDATQKRADDRQRTLLRKADILIHFTFSKAVCAIVRNSDDTVYTLYYIYMVQKLQFELISNNNEYLSV